MPDINITQAAILNQDSPFIVFSDFDGTITTEDSNDHMTDNLGFGRDKRRALNLAILNGQTTFRDGFREMLDSVSERHSFQECQETLKKNIKLDPGFKEFFDWSKKANVPVVIISSGMVPIIRSILENLLGPEDAARIEIVANEVQVQADGKFSIQFRHPESGFGHDKSKALRIYRELQPKPTIFFAGDGVSDMCVFHIAESQAKKWSAAGESDVLFVKIIPGGANDLAKHCHRNNVDFIPFSSFVKVKEYVQSVVEGKASVPDLVQEGRHANAAMQA